MSPSEAQRQRAAELSAEARELLGQRKYTEARERYEESLALHYDEDVEAAYLRVLSAIYPE